MKSYTCEKSEGWQIRLQSCHKHTLNTLQTHLYSNAPLTIQTELLTHLVQKVFHLVSLNHGKFQLAFFSGYKISFLFS